MTGQNKVKKDFQVAWTDVMRCVLYSIASLLLLGLVESSSFTFELPDGETRCFYAVLKQDERTTVEFQVTSGGNFDIDVTLRDPTTNPVKVLQREQYDYFDYTARMEGEHELCFSNEFSSVTHKVVYMNWDLESEKADPLGDAPVNMVDSIIYTIHENLRNAAAAQTRVRLQEATSRSFVEALNERVTWGSLIHVAVILFVAVGQVYLLRSLFNSPSSAAAALPSRNRIIPTVGY
ncbi:Transmembrane emp24 domain-containing protein 7 [Echinococcus granulosus]|uniref:Transmembrane emp24 domain containing protein 7 n=2 Tax=Echinococcus granulosus TaxID=6210 RepID=A0A068X2L1_ECHGR|nr:Transmembrane emp24 domain-containing protein 7 [Echinococcus granulosus]CDS24139.1 transmembrane emp24 domain containing protein 7 [Echinococcus granulosus]